MILALMLGASLDVQGDFDHDGRREMAHIVRVKDGYEVVVDHADGRRQIVDHGDFNDPYVAINRDRGWVRTACGKGYDLECTHRDPKRIFLRGGELLFGDRESSDFVVIYRKSRAIVVHLTE